MNTHRFVRDHLLKRSCLSILLSPLGKLYGWGQAIRRRKLMDKGWYAPCKIISIGNITAGGSGKTPLTIALARMLQESGIQVGVSHRGYKGRYEHIPTLVSTPVKVLYPADTIGDEAYMIASALPGIPVVVGRQRKQAIKLMLKLFPGIKVMILDDSFQHLQVRHDLNILSFCAESGLGNGFVLPAGYLRESLNAISKTDWAVIYARNGSSNTQAWEKDIQSRVGRLYNTHSGVTQYQNARGELHPVKDLRGRSISLVSGIANPDSFERTLKRLGLPFQKHYAYPDHFDFQDEACLHSLMSDPSELLICTQKDLMKLARHNALVPRLVALVQDYHFEAEEEFTRSILELISQQ